MTDSVRHSSHGFREGHLTASLLGHLMHVQSPAGLAGEVMMFAD